MTQIPDNLFADLPIAVCEEFVDVLAQSKNVRIERIVSTGQSNPQDFWYDQDEHEWVVVLIGEGKILFDDGRCVQLKPGDHVLIRPTRSIAWSGQLLKFDLSTNICMSLALKLRPPNGSNRTNLQYKNTEYRHELRKDRPTEEATSDDIENSYPAVAQWVQCCGWIEIGDQESPGFSARALDGGGVVFEDENCRSLTEAMESLEAGLAVAMKELGIN